MNLGTHIIDPKYMYRCLQLAQKGAWHTAPNPMVGAVLVHNNMIIGEGYHQQFGGPHAEVNCINNAIENGFRAQLSAATLYVSLEPCAHTGKTPPCTDLVIAHNIPRVVIGSTDPYKEVSGRGIRQLQEAGIQVYTGLIEDACNEVNKRFFHFHIHQRPYVLLKWAQTADGIMGNEEAERLFISGDASNRLVHKWRCEEAAILVGTRTVLKDNPRLTARYWSGPQPVRLVVDRKNVLPAHASIFSSEATTIVISSVKHTMPQSAHVSQLEKKTYWYQTAPETEITKSIIALCMDFQIQSVLVEGGAAMLGTFINQRLWDEARIITNSTLFAGKGIAAPLLTDAALVDQQILGNDIISYFRPQNK